MSTEHSEQIGFLNWFRARFPSVLIFAIPNGGYRSITTAKKLKMEGVVPGIPDLFVPKWRLWIEMKNFDGGTLSKEQTKIIYHLQEIGYFVIIGNGATDASVKVLGFFRKEHLIGGRDE